MSNREDLLNVFSGNKRPERIPFITNGFWNERAIHKLVPDDCYDENTYYIPSDNPPQNSFSSAPRTQESREKAVRMAEYMDMATIGVGKGGVFPFGHGGPGEIQPVVVERTRDHKILQYEGGHMRYISSVPHSIRYYNFPVREEKDIESMKLPDMSNADRFKDVEEDSRFFKESGFVPTGSIQGFFSGIHNSFMDFQDTMVNLLLKPEFMKRLIEILAVMNLTAAEMLMDRGVEIVEICDDLGNAGGLLISPELVRNFFIPWYEELAKIVHERNGYVHLHSHGNISLLLPDLVTIGIDAINPFDWEENPDLPETVKKFGDRIIFCGGEVGDLYRHSLEEIEFIIRRACRLNKIAKRGYIFMGGIGIEDLSQEKWDSLRRLISKIRSEKCQW